MIALLLIIGFGFLAVGAYYFIKALWMLGKALYFRFFASENSINKEYIKHVQGSNPYVKAHLAKMQNDKSYQEYLEWLNNNGGDLPFEKWKTKEEIEFEDKLNSPQRFKL